MMSIPFHLFQFGRRLLIICAIIGAFVAVPAFADDLQGWGPGHSMMWGGPSREWFGWRESDSFCGDKGPKMIERFSALVERKIKLTDMQKPAFETFKAALQSSMKDLQPLCEKPHGGRWSPVERLTIAESHLTALLSAIRMIRAPLENFYTMLDDTQKKEIDDLRPDWRMRLPWAK